MHESNENSLFGSLDGMSLIVMEILGFVNSDLGSISNFSGSGIGLQVLIRMRIVTKCLDNGRQVPKFAALKMFNL